uniref:RNA binding motif protein 4.1 n=1 Tax=Neogobius melanostomus TaxID=47308 RepID=A0A8C6TPK9_9GOBI
MVKIFVGNLAAETTSDELLSLFSQYGKISECDIVKNFGFVHMDDKSQAEEPMNVELSRGKSKGSAKLHVGNIACTNQELRAKFEEFGPVSECDIVKNYAFVHMDNMDDAMEAINKLDNAAFKGKLMSVKLSTSRLRTAPGMGDRASCYRCGEEGHWSKECPLDQNGYRNGSGPRSDGFDAPRFAGRGRNRGFNPGFSGGEPEYGGGYPPVPSSRGTGYRRGAGYESSVRYAPPPPAAYGGVPDQDVTRMYSGDASYRSSGSYYGAVPSYPARRSAYERDPYVDYYERYRAGAGAYDGNYYDERRAVAMPAPPTSASSGVMRERLPPSSHASLDPYNISNIPSIPLLPPIRRVPEADGYSYARPSVPTLQRSSTFDHPRDPAADRARYGY